VIEEARIGNYNFIPQEFNSLRNEGRAWFRHGLYMCSYHVKAFGTMDLPNKRKNGTGG
jgi:hypothetical protein